MSIQNLPTPAGGHFIPLIDAIDMTNLYRSQLENILQPEMKDREILPLSETFSREAFDTLLAQEGCEGIRFYLGMDESLKIHIIAVGVNNMNEDMLNDQESLIIENSWRCPNTCPPVSVLNS